MFRTLLTTTALATFIAGGAIAQTNTTTQQAPAATEQAPVTTTNPTMTNEQAAPVVRAEGYLASNIIGETVYNGTGDKAENIGDVNDIVLDKDGKAKSIIIGVGGFLGIGEKNVEIAFDKIDWVEENGDRWIVVAATKDQLEAQPAFDRSAYDVLPASMTTGSTKTAPLPSTTAPATGAPAEMAPAHPNTDQANPNAAPAEQPKPAN